MTDYSTAGPPAGGASGPRAGFGPRLLAAIVDSLILGAVSGVSFGVAGQRGSQGIGTIVAIIYYSYFEGSPSGQTVGKRLMKIRVIDAASGGPLGFGKAFLRYIGKVISSIPCLLGFFWMLWDKEKQTWHDKIATTYVVPTTDYPVDAWPG